MVEEVGMHSPSFSWLFLMYLIQLRATQRNPELRAAWAHKMSMYTPNQLIFVDELAANERTSHRKCSWSPKGVHPHENITSEVNDGWFFLHIRSMVFSLGILNTDLSHKNCSKISSKTSFCHSATHSLGHDQSQSWIMPQFISQRYIKMPVYN